MGQIVLICAGGILIVLAALLVISRMINKSGTNSPPTKANSWTAAERNFSIGQKAREILQ